MMDVGIIGAGRLGQAVARTALRAGRQVVISNSRSSQVLAELVPGARVVKAANTLEAGVLAADPHEAGGRRVIFLSGDGAAAKSEVGALFDAAGSAVIDLGGPIVGGAMQQFHGPLAGPNLIRLP